MSQDLDDFAAVQEEDAEFLSTSTGVGAADAAEAVLDRADLTRRPDRFLGALLDGMGAEGLLQRHPARIFDALVLGRDDGEAERLHALFEIVALPGQAPANRLRAGDVLIRRTDGGRGHAAVLAESELQAADNLETLGLHGEAAVGGRYARVAEPGGRARPRARRVLDGAGRAPFDQMILRLRGGGFAESFADADFSSREYVRWLQDALNRITGSALAVDGLYGAQTRGAVRAFQQSKGLTVDGIVGPKTDAALRQSLGGAQGAQGLKLPTRCLGIPERQTIDNFEFGKSDVLPRHQPQIVNTAFCLLASQRSSTPITTLTMVGHTDPVGDVAANEALGRRRAETVADQIKQAMERISGKKPARLTVTIETRGEREPIPGDPGMSRRVEVIAPFAFPVAKPVPPKPKPPIPVPPKPASILDPPRWRPIISRAISPNAVLRAGNNVRHLIDAEHPTPALSGYAAMVDDINAARGPGSFIYLLGWALVDDFEMIPCRPNTTARALFAMAAAGGAQIRAVLWKQVPLTDLRTQTHAAGKNINDLHAVAGLDAAAIIDGETLNLGSHHQKVLVIKGEKGLVAYVGGLDINHDRINRCRTGPAPSPGGGGGSGPSGPGSTPASPPHSMPPSAPLHDVHCRIDGPAAFDLLTTFLRRWDHHPDHVAIDTRRALIGRGVTTPPAAKTSSPASQSSTGATCSVAIARTFNPVTRGTAVPRERDIRTLLLEAIYSAQRFIYMEDQYLISLDAARALNSVVPRLQHLTILIGATQNVADLPCIWTFRRNFVDALTNGLSASDLAKVRIFRLATPPNPSPLPACGAATPGFTPRFGEHTYVHTKSWFFDDELAVIGTANCNRRGWEHDSEVNAFIFDDARPSGSSRTFCQQTRMDLWAEHLNAPASRFADGVASAPLWLAPPAGHRVLRYCPNEGTDAAPSLCDSLREGIDPGQR